ncbi:MAG: 30S ribosomal protein S21 [Bacteriovoracales bacterium]|nr:30S ribosomal protein S21 [Bacteriovoracales bacterium]
MQISVSGAFGIDRSLRKFKRLCESYGVIREYKKRREYKKPSVKRLEKSLAAEKRRKKADFKNASARRVFL